MPQVLKEEIRQRIEKAALDEFYEKGYKFATMKGIAANAGIPTGLIYSYFKNKEELFKIVVAPVFVLLSSVNAHSEAKRQTSAENVFERELPQIMNCVNAYHKQLVVLIDRSAGSSLADFKEKLIDDVAIHLKTSPLLRKTDYHQMFYRILAANFMEGIFEIARHYVDKHWAEKMLELLVKQHLYGVSALAK